LPLKRKKDCLNQGIGEPAARLNICFGPHQNFRYPVRARVKMKLHDKQVS